MFKIILPTILVGLAVAVFLVFTVPLYGEIGDVSANISSYDEALNNSKALENERDKLTQKLNSISVENLGRLEKLLPENVDNIRLILEIEKIAAPYGMALKDVKYDTLDAAQASQPGVVDGSGIVPQSSNTYGTWNLEFSVTGSYNNFLNFVRDLESNLRIVDISSIEFSSEVPSGAASATASSVYKYNFKIKTYWLKN